MDRGRRLNRRPDGRQVPLNDDHAPRPLWRRVLAGITGVVLRRDNRADGKP
jgi:hypothetical protein